MCCIRYFSRCQKVVPLRLILPLTEIRNEIQEKEAKHIGVRFARGIKILGLAENLPLSPNIMRATGSELFVPDGLVRETLQRLASYLHECGRTIWVGRIGPQ